MLYLKEINLEDAKKEYECYRQIPKDENGFTNDYAGVTEEELYLSCHVDNPASLAVQQKNGAVIHHSDGTSYFTRIPFKQNRKEGGEDR